MTMSDTPTPEQPSIFDLMNAVRKHPDYVWGTVFTWEDVQTAFDETDEEDRAEGVTMDVLRDEGHGIGKTLESWAMETGFSWADAIRDNHITTRW